MACIIRIAHPRKHPPRNRLVVWGICGLIGLAAPGPLGESPAAHAETNKELYELQELCANAALAAFKRRESKRIENYENHYNAKLNECFMVIISDLVGLKNGASSLVHSMEDILDVNENRTFGSLSEVGNERRVTICYVLKQHCHSHGEWDELVRPFMEE